MNYKAARHSSWDYIAGAYTKKEHWVVFRLRVG